jgi:hypothetical protein
MLISASSQSRSELGNSASFVDHPTTCHSTPTALRLVQGYAHEREPVWIFLTLHGEVPRDGQFHSMTLAEFAACLSHALHHSPEPHKATASQAGPPPWTISPRCGG